MAQPNGLKNTEILTRECVFPGWEFRFSKGKSRFSVGKFAFIQGYFAFIQGFLAFPQGYFGFTEGKNRFPGQKNAFFEVFACEGTRRRIFLAPKH